MYKSPIEIITAEIEEKYEDGIIKVVNRYAVNCDKEELLRALAYDRGQYRKGYEDGRLDSDRMSELIRCKDCRYFCSYSDGTYACDSYFGMVTDSAEGYCSQAERKE